MIIVLKGATNKMCVVRVQNIAAQGQEKNKKQNSLMKKVMEEW